MNRYVGGAVGRNEALKGGESCAREILGKCPKNKSGEYSTGYSNFVKGMFCFICIFGEILCVLEKLIIVIFEDTIKKEDQLMMNISVIVATCVFVSIFILCRKIIFYKYTLTKKGLLIKKVFSKQLIEYSQLKVSVEKWPVIQYKGDLIFIINDKMLKLPYAALVGGFEFASSLLDILEIDYLTGKMLVSKVQNGMAIKNTKEEKIAYKERKKYIKNIR